MTLPLVVECLKFGIVHQCHLNSFIVRERSFLNDYFFYFWEVDSFQSRTIFITIFSDNLNLFSKGYLFQGSAIFKSVAFKYTKLVVKVKLFNVVAFSSKFDPLKIDDLPNLSLSSIIASCNFFSLFIRIICVRME